jgi:CRP-like cAMP-binding protein
VCVIGEALAKHLNRVGVLSPEDRQAVLEVKGEVRLVRRHEDIVKSGSAPTFCVLVLRGFLQRYSSRRDGSRQVHSFYIPGDAPSLESIHLDIMDNSICAVVNSEVALIPHAEIKSLLAARPAVDALVWRSSLVQASIYREWLMRNSRLPADAAMAHLFCEMYVRSDAAGLVDQNSCDVPLTQEVLADALGLTGVHVNRTLQSLRETGFVDHKNGRLFVHDVRKLASFADFEPLYLHLRNGQAARRSPERQQTGHSEGVQW